MEISGAILSPGICGMFIVPGMPIELPGKVGGASSNEAIGTEPVGCTCAKTEPSDRTIAACAGMPIYGCRSCTGFPEWSVTRKCRISGTPARRGASRSHRMWPPSGSGYSAVLVSEAMVLRSEEHTSELQSHLNLVCRLLLEK